MIKINLVTKSFSQGSEKELAKKLDKIQELGQAIDYDLVHEVIANMAGHLHDILPDDEGVGAKMTCAVRYNSALDKSTSVPVGAKMTVVKHKGFVEANVSPYYGGYKQSYDGDLDISKCLNPEKIKESILGRALRWYENATSTKINL